MTAALMKGGDLTRTRSEPSPQSQNLSSRLDCPFEGVDCGGANSHLVIPLGRVGPSHRWIFSQAPSPPGASRLPPQFVCKKAPSVPSPTQKQYRLNGVFIFGAIRFCKFGRRCSSSYPSLHSIVPLDQTTHSHLDSILCRCS
jgi:hypothetical protein